MLSGTRLALMSLIASSLLGAPVAAATAGTAPALSASAGASAVESHAVSVDGPGVRMYPEFSPDVERYAITTTDATGGEVTVRASSSDRGAAVLVNGRPVSGDTTVGGLEPGDEISVIFRASSGEDAVHSLIYLPAGFPLLERVTPAADGLAPGSVLLTLSTYSGSPVYEAAVDRNGVPVHVHEESASSMDFKRQPNGQLTVSRHSASSNGRDGSAVVVLDESLSPIDTFETQGLANTDGHDSLLLPDGRRFLIAYERNGQTGKVDAIIQGFAPGGALTFEWNSADHVDIPTESVLPDNPDYAHINSIVLTQDGNILASFRHFSAVFKIALRTEDGHESGDVLWRLGGHHSDFDFVADPHYGPCAQHTASELPNGNILIFDNGSYGGMFDELCIDPDDPTGDEIARQFSRVTEYAIDEAAGTATLVSSFTEADRAALFAGGVAQVANGNRLINWASSRAVTATEISPEGEKLWELRDATPGDGDRYFSYRADLATLEDTFAPKVHVSRPAQGGLYGQGQQLPLLVECTDRGGSSLHACTIDGGDGDDLATGRVGQHTVNVTAVDGAGNSTTREVSYRVAAYRPDAWVKKKGRRYVGRNVYGASSRQDVRLPLPRSGKRRTSFVRVVNNAPVRDRFTIKAPRGGGKFRSRYYIGKRDVTSRVAAGRLRTPVLDPGEKFILRVRTHRRTQARPGDQRRFKVRATSRRSDPRRKDTVAIVARAR